MAAAKILPITELPQAVSAAAGPCCNHNLVMLVCKPGAMTLSARSTQKRSAIKAKPTMEHTMSGQIGHPAACMMLVKLCPCVVGELPNVGHQPLSMCACWN
jgi:hypothetical protein